MNIVEFIRAVAALAFTLGLVGLAGWAMRRFGPDAMARLVAGQKDRRLKIVESLALDPTRRLVLFSLDGHERLILLGEGEILPVETQPSVKPKRSKSTPETAA
jgi:flagellar protein FliO/FliZ